MTDQHSSDKINRQHVIESSVEFLLKQVSNQKLHVANLLAKTGDTDSYAYLQSVYKDIEETLKDIGYEALEETKEYYNH